jgi:hypothetical protein
MAQIVESAQTNGWDTLGKFLPIAGIIVGAYFIYTWLTGQSSSIYTNGGTPTNGSNNGQGGPSSMATGLFLSNGQAVGTSATKLIEAGPATNVKFWPLGGMTMSRSADPSEAAYLTNTGQVGNQWLAKNNVPLMPSSAGSVSRYAIFTGSVLSTKSGSVLEMVSGRDTPIAGQVAVYNPATGKSWGGNSNTVNYLYNSSDPAAAAWRARFA